MTTQQEEHLRDIKMAASIEIDTKYRKGAIEHAHESAGGDLSKRGLLSCISKEIRAEALDLVSYTHCLEEGLIEIRKISQRGLKSDSEGYLEEIIRVLDGAN